MKLFSLGKYKLSFLLSLIYCIMLIISPYIHSPVVFNNPIFNGSWIALGAILGGLPKIIYDIYIKYKSKKTRTQESRLLYKSKFSYVATKVSYPQILLIALLIISMAMIQLVQDLYIAYEFPTESQQSYLIFLLSMSSFLILYDYFHPSLKKLYIHHYAAMVIIIISSIMMLYSFVYYNMMIVVQFAKGIIWGIILYSLKYIMENKYIHPLTLVFYDGLTYLMLLWSTYLICHFGKINESLDIDLSTLKDRFLAIIFSVEHSIYLIANLIIFSGINTLSFCIIFYENPLAKEMVYLLAYGLNICLQLIIYNIRGVMFYFCLVGILFSGFGTLMLLEIFNVHCFGLHENTEMSIDLRCYTEDNSIVDIMIKDNI